MHIKDFINFTLKIILQRIKYQKSFSSFDSEVKITQTSSLKSFCQIKKVLAIRTYATQKLKKKKSIWIGKKM